MSLIKHFARGFLSSQMRNSVLPMVGKRLYINYDHEIEESFEASSDEPQSHIQSVNKATLVGQLKYDPYTINADGKLIGYNLVVETKSLMKTEDQVPYTKNVYHSVSCFNKRFFPILNNIQVDDWVMVDGYMAYYAKEIHGEHIYKMTVRATNLVPIKNPI